MKKLYIPITLILLSLCLTACHGKESREYRVDVTYEELNGHSTLTRVK